MYSFQLSECRTLLHILAFFHFRCDSHMCVLTIPVAFLGLSRLSCYMYSWQTIVSDDLQAIFIAHHLWIFHFITIFFQSYSVNLFSTDQILCWQATTVMFQGPLPACPAQQGTTVQLPHRHHVGLASTALPWPSAVRTAQRVMRAQDPPLRLLTSVWQGHTHPAAHPLVLTAPGVISALLTACPHQSPVWTEHMPPPQGP